MFKLALRAKAWMAPAAFNSAGAETSMVNRRDERGGTLSCRRLESFDRPSDAGAMTGMDAQGLHRPARGLEWVQINRRFRGMHKLLRLSALAATIVMLAAIPAQAVKLTIGYELPTLTPGTVTEVGNSVNPVYGTYADNFVSFNWDVNASMWGASTFQLTGIVEALLNPYSIVNAISVYLTMSDITSPVGVPVTFTNTMTVPSLPDGWTLNRTVYIDDASAPDGGNHVFSKMQYLNAPQLYSTAGTEVKTSTWYVPNGTYSITQFYGFQAVPHHAPGPLVGAGIPGLVTGMLGLLVWARGRRQRQQS